MAKVENYINLIVKTIEAIIPSGNTTSNIINLLGATVKTIILPPAFDGSEFYFQVSDDGINFYDYYNADDDRVTIKCTQNRAYGFAAIDFFSLQYIKIVSDANEGADRVLKLITRGF